MAQLVLALLVWQNSLHLGLWVIKIICIDAPTLVLLLKCERKVVMAVESTFSSYNRAKLGRPGRLSNHGDNDDCDKQEKYDSDRAPEEEARNLFFSLFRQIRHS